MSPAQEVTAWLVQVWHRFVGLLGTAWPVLVLVAVLTVAGALSRRSGHRGS